MKHQAVTLIERFMRGFMGRFGRGSAAVTLVLLSQWVATPALADWVEKVEGTVTYPSGRTAPVNYKFAFLTEQGQTYFYAGEQKVATDSVPPNYILNMIVNKEGELYVPELSQGSILGFNIRVGDQHIKIERRAAAAGEQFSVNDYKVLIDGRNMLFDTTHPTILFEFDDTGVTGINGSGYKKDLSIKSID